MITNIKAATNQELIEMRNELFDYFDMSADVEWDMINDPVAYECKSAQIDDVCLEMTARNFGVLKIVKV